MAVARRRSWSKRGPLGGEPGRRPGRCTASTGAMLYPISGTLLKILYFYEFIMSPSYAYS